MAEASEAMKAMARRVADQLIPNPDKESVVYKSFHQTAERAALAAIIETQRADAEMVQHMADERREERDRLPHPDGDLGHEILTRIAILERAATSIRTGNHYAKDENNG